MVMKNILRKLLLILIATINSEILSTSQTFSTIFANPLLLFIYFFSFIMMDEIVQRYNLTNKAIFYMGSIFGLILEGFVAFTLVADPIAPFIMIPLIAIGWHGLITTLLTFTIVEILISRKEKKMNKFWMILGLIFWIGLLSLTIIATIGLIVSMFWAYIIIITLIIIFFKEIKKSIKSKDKYKPKIKLAIGAIIIGLIMNILISENPFTILDYTLMGIFYLTVLILLIKNKP
jgi:hypothetical protein